MNYLYCLVEDFLKLSTKSLNQYSLKKIASAINSTDRINLSRIKFDTGKLILSRDASNSTNKPDAFYYSFGDQWINQTNFESGDVYRLDLNMSRVLVLSPRFGDLDWFIRKYCNDIDFFEAIAITQKETWKPLTYGLLVNWDLVKRDYDGVEIRDLAGLKAELQRLKRKFNYSDMPLLDSLDVDGGFFWRPSVLQSATKIASIRNNTIEELADPESYKLQEKAIITNKFRLALNPNTPLDTLAILATDPNEGIRARVGLHENTSTEILETLSSDQSVVVRCSVADNPNTPTSVLETLLQDVDQEVREIASENINKKNSV